MRIVIAGKGGSGKTTIAAILAGTIARRGDPVVAADTDPSQSLALALGLDPAQNRTLPLPGSDGAPDPAPEDDLLEEWALRGPDGLLLLPAGSPPALRDRLAERRVVVTDLEPGVRPLLRTPLAPGDTVLVLTEAYRKSLEVARRAVEAARELGVQRVLVVANRLEGPGDADEVRHTVPGVRMVQVPEDPALARAHREGRSVLEAPPASPAARAVQALAGRLVR